MKKIKASTFDIAGVYIGTVIGAGFASGQEIMKFFTSYGYKGIYGILLSGVLFSILGWGILEMGYAYKIRDYRGFIYFMMGDFLGNIMERIVSLFMFISFCTMLAGAGALFKQQFQWPAIVGILIMAALCFLVFLYDIKGIIVINSILVPFLFIGGIYLGIHSIIYKDTAVFSSILMGSFHFFTNNWLSSSLVYASYNILTAAVILSSLFPAIKSVKEAKRGGILGGAALTLLGLSVVIATLIYYDKIEGLEIPILGIVVNYGQHIEYIFLLVLIAAIFTTAVANGYGFLTRFCDEFDLTYKSVIPYFMLTSVLVALIGFSTMVTKLYSFFGYIGIFELFIILIYFIHYKINKKRI